MKTIMSSVHFIFLSVKTTQHLFDPALLMLCVCVYAQTEKFIANAFRNFSV